MATCAFITLGCKLNYAETSTYERALVGAGFSVVSPREKADYYIVNTCTVTEHADKKDRNMIAKCHRTNPEASIIVVGCYATLASELIAQIPGVVKVFTQSRKSFVVPFIIAHNAAAKAGLASEQCTAQSSEHCEGTAPECFPAFSSGERTRSFLKVQDGCDYYCKYCTVPFARGHSRNLSIAECVAQAREIAAKGIKEIVLTGVNTGDYGKTTGETFLDLLKALNDVEGIERYRISSIEPNLITNEIIDWISTGTKFLPHFHIPLQSGSDAVLGRMGRRYTTAFFADKVEYIREKMGRDVFFGIDVIVGFPGETDELFGETVAFLEKVRPAFIHVFPYSRRKGTVADAMPDQVDEFIKTYRVQKLESLCAELSEEFRRKCEGRPSKVLFESKLAGQGLMQGYTDNYIQVTAPYEKSKIGKIVDVVL